MVLLAWRPERVPCQFLQLFSLLPKDLVLEALGNPSSLLFVLLPSAMRQERLRVRLLDPLLVPQILCN